MAKTVLVINSGSSSIKYQLVDLETGEGIASGLVEKIGEPVDGHYKHEFNGEKHELEEPIHDHEQGLKRVLGFFNEFGPKLADAGIVAVGHRVVQGGSIFPKPALVNDKTIGQVKDLAVLAPLHNGPEAKGAEVMRSLLPDVPQIFVFDSSFFFQLPKASSTYALNKEVAQQYHIRRYGAHGTSHEFISSVVPSVIGKPAEGLKQIVLHIGNGASASAEISGKPVETSMGLTPLEGLMMGGRTGDIDPAVVFHLIRNAHMNVDELDALFNKRSGMMGMTGYGDLREVHRLVGEGNEDAKLALDVYVHRIVGYIGNYTAPRSRASSPLRIPQSPSASSRPTRSWPSPASPPLSPMPARTPTATPSPSDERRFLTNIGETSFVKPCFECSRIADRIRNTVSFFRMIAGPM